MSAARICLFLYLLLGLTAAGCRRDVNRPVPMGEDGGSKYARVVTLSPSLSEVMFALGLGDRVVGVTAFANYPEAVLELPKVGGYSEVNVEAVYALSPDLVLSLGQQDDVRRRLEALGIPVVALENERMTDVIAMITRIGSLFGRQTEAAALTAQIETASASLQQKAMGRPRRKVMVCVGRNMGNSSIGDVYVAGPSTLFGEIVALSGGVNVYQGAAPYTALGREAILRLNPEVIIDLIPDMDKMQGFTQATALEQWQAFSEIDAVREHRVTICVASYICVPGPRIVHMMQDIAAAIYPEPRPPEETP